MGRLRRWLANPETIGPPECPLMLRWTIIAAGEPTVNRGNAKNDEVKPFTLIELPKWLTRDRKLMVHNFLPNVEDRDPHDHPRGFWTLVIRGHYFDLVPCPCCHGTQDVTRGEGGLIVCDCREGLVVGDVMMPGTLRYRPAEHTHMTQSSSEGAWTIVVMSPLSRPWGFWREGTFWPWKKYEEKFGFAMRCPSDEEIEGEMLKYSDEMAEPQTFTKHAPVGLSRPDEPWEGSE